MDLKNIKMLARLMNESDLTAIEVAEGDSKIRLERNFAATLTEFKAEPQNFKTRPAVNVVDQVLPSAGGIGGIGTINVKGNGIDFNNVTEVKSPMIGVFYSAPSPKDNPFVKVGSKVKKGDTLCIIEAMKIMNEISSDRDGEIVDICATDGQLVEFSQVLFKIF